MKHHQTLWRGLSILLSLVLCLSLLPATARAAGTTYTVTFNANGGSVTPANAQTGADGKLSSLPRPARATPLTAGTLRKPAARRSQPITCSLLTPPFMPGGQGVIPLPL